MQGRVRLETAFWRALAACRIAALAYAVALVAHGFRKYQYPAGAWIVVAVMVVWTLFTVYWYAHPHRRRWPMLACDLGVGVLCVLSTRFVAEPDGIDLGESTVASMWVSAPVLAWAIAGGRRVGLTAAIIVAVADLSVRDGITHEALNAIVLLLLAGFGVGYVARLAFDAERRLEEAVQLEAATAERERLARGIHDSVLQVLALVQRRGAELGGAAADLGRLAGEQEVALRTLVTAGGVEARDGGTGDVRELLGRFAAADTMIVGPAGGVLLPLETATEAVAAVSAALDNVRRHAGHGARAWVLLEDTDEAVTVTVRDDGRGMDAERLAAAERDGRLGVAQSIRGRIRDLGGRVSIHTRPGEGTEVEMHIPRTVKP